MDIVMLEVARVLTAVALAWAVVALAWQARTARGGGRVDHSRGAGSRAGGIAYAFTTAMLPRNKESARLHPREFAIGMVLHVGVFAALLDVLLLVVWPGATPTVEPVLLPFVVVAIPAGCALLVRRRQSAVLRAMSSPDDFVAISAVLLLLVLAGLQQLGWIDPAVLLVFASLLLLYLPLGKLRHAVFFFIARADYGRRLGHRGVYPPPASPAPAEERPRVVRT